MMPVNQTTPYPVFVLLRAYSYAGFLLLVTVVYNLGLRERGAALQEFIIWLAIIVTLYAFYILAAQRLGLPQPPKGRYGTGEGGAIAGGEEGNFAGENRFLFRTIGSFREPSFLGIWLVLPFFYSLIERHRRRFHWRSILIGLGVLSTGSLTA